jgi:hypothetical protein
MPGSGSGLELHEVLCITYAPLCLEDFWLNGHGFTSEEAGDVLRCYLHLFKLRGIHKAQTIKLITDQFATLNGLCVLTPELIESEAETIYGNHDSYENTNWSLCKQIGKCRAGDFCDKDGCEWPNQKTRPTNNVNQDTQADGTKGKWRTRQSAATQLTNESLNRVELWKSTENLLYATVKVNEHYENYQLESSQFKQWLSKLFYDLKGKTPADNVVKDTIRVLEGVALSNGQTYDTFFRVGHDLDKKKIYVDLGQESWNAIEITQFGWQLIDNAPIKFIRNSEMKPLPTPARGGSWYDLDNVIGDVGYDNKIIITSWLVQSFWPFGPYCHLVLIGEQGTLKSLITMMLKSLADPSKAPLRPRPDPQSLLIQARWSHILAIDNLSGVIDGALSDTLCCLSTGAGLANRKLYTNFDQAVMEARRPVIMNGIDVIIPRGDLNDRTMFVELPRIESFRTESDVLEEFETLWPSLLGLVLDATSQGLKDTIQLDHLPRMADFVKWVANCEPALPWDEDEFLETYQENKRTQIEDMLTVDNFSRTLWQYVLSTVEAIETTPADLLFKLEIFASIPTERKYKPDGWPLDAARLGTKLRRIAPLFRVVGIDIRTPSIKGKRLVKITRIGGVTVNTVIPIF